ncbi:MAG: phytoene/squalene synthase family protein [Nannocystaceae bacterium]
MRRRASKPGRSSLGEPGFGRFKFGKLKLGKFKLGKLKLGALKFGAFNFEKLKSGEVKSGKLKLGKLKLGKFNFGKLKPGKLKLGAFNFGKPKSERLSCGKPKSERLKPEKPKPEKLKSEQFKRRKFNFEERKPGKSKLGRFNLEALRAGTLRLRERSRRRSDPDDRSIVAESHQALRVHARSFRWAATFLPADRRDDAAVLYAFCREADDAVDEAADPASAERRLAVFERGLEATDEAGEAPPICRALRDLAARRGLPLDAARQLLEGMRGDLQAVRVADDRELLRYCYRAAGTVGRLMCGVLGVADPRAFAHAIDLGIAMQLTNICRDVAEDAGRGRVYLPEARLRGAGTSAEALLAAAADGEAVARVVRELLALAERYYASAEAGMRYIPARPRLAIVVAARIYRAIGRRLLRVRSGRALEGRTVVPPWEKSAWLLASVVRWSAGLVRAPGPSHRRALHLHLDGLVP